MSPARPGVGLREVARGWRWGGRPLVPASAQAHRPSPAPREFPTDWARSPAARAARSAFLRTTMDPLLRSQLTCTVRGAEVFAELGDQPVLIVANHASHLDASLLLCALPQAVRDRTAVTAAADYFFESTWRGLSTALAFGTVPIDRRGGAASSTPLDLIRDGNNLVIFPEGTRTADGARGRFRLGAAQLALSTGVPVVPVGLRGTFRAMPRGRTWPIPGRPAVSVQFGRPLRPAADTDVRAFTARLAAEVDRLLVEGETSWWESLRATPPGGPGTGSRTQTTRPGAGPGGAGTVSGTPVRSVEGAEPARWRKVWAATEPPADSGPRSPWAR